MGECGLKIKKRKIEKSESESESDWLSTLLKCKFFTICNHHQNLPKNEINLFCLDCSLGFCKHCLNVHRHHRRFRICKYVYHDVIRLQDITQYLNCSKIQTYKINGEKAIHLNPRPFFKDVKQSTKSKTRTGPHCEACHKYIQDLPNRFCSIACKVEIEGAEKLDKNSEMKYVIDEVSKLGQSEESSDAKVTLEESASSSVSSSTHFSGESSVPITINVRKPGNQNHKRKGTTPRRAPLF